VGGPLLVSGVLVKAAVLGVALDEVVGFPAACRPEGGQCSEVLQVDVPVAAGTPVEDGGGEGVVGSRDKQSCSPIRDRGHSSCRKQLLRMSGRRNRNILTAIISRQARHR